MKNILKSIFTLSFIVSILSFQTFAAISFSNTDGTGWVDKDNVLYSLGFSRKQMQNEKDLTTFTFVTNVSYTVKCSDDPLDGTYGTLTQTEEISIESSIRYGRRNSFEGYNFNGFGSTIDTSNQVLTGCNGSTYSSIVAENSRSRGFIYVHNGSSVGKIYY